MSVTSGLRLPRGARRTGGSRRAEPGSLVRPVPVVGAVLVLMFVVGVLRVSGNPEGLAGVVGEGGLWSVGLGAGLAAAATGARRRAAVVVAVSLVTFASASVAGLVPGVATAWALGATAEAWLVARMVARDPSGRPRLMDHSDLVRLLLASVTACGTGAVLAALVIPLGVGGGGWDDVGPLLLIISVTHLVSHLLFVPFFLRVPDDPPTAGHGERVLQTVLVALVAPALFLPDFPGTVYLIFPLLAWGAIRCGFRWAMAQSALLGVVATQLTLRGLGPFTATQPELPSPFLGSVLLQGYVLCGIAVTLPLTLAIAHEHLRAATALEERRRAEALVRSTVGTAIVATDPFGRVRLANPGALQLFGYDATTLVSLSIGELFAQGELADHARELGVPPELGAVMTAMSATGERREWIVRRADGEARAHLLGFAHLADESGGGTGFVLTSEDITEAVRTHESLVAALIAEHAGVKRLEELDGAKDALVSTVSHELRTPITSIVGFVELLRDGDFGELAPDQARAMERVHENSHRLLALIDDLLVLARMKSGDMELDLRPVDLRDAVRSAWHVLEPRLRGRELSVSMELGRGPAGMRGDQNQIERLAVNLIGNAIKFTPDGGRVVIRLRRQGESRLQLEVSDTGIGIPQDEQGQLFSQFFRSRLASEQAIPGTGLGLSIVQAIAEQHGGSVVAESEAGLGTTFRVELPASDEHTGEATGAAAAATTTLAPMPAYALIAGQSPPLTHPAPAAPAAPPAITRTDDLQETPSVEELLSAVAAASFEPGGVGEAREDEPSHEVPAGPSAACRLAAAGHSAAGSGPDDPAPATLDAVPLKPR